MRKKLLILVGVAALVGISFFWYMFRYADVDIYPPQYAMHCAECHGDDLEGGSAIALIESRLEGGDSVAAMMQSIRNRHDNQFDQELSADQIKGLAMYIGERRLGQRFIDFKMYQTIDIPSETITTEKHSFRFETVVDDLQALPYSIEPMRDGSILLTERSQGLSVISPEGEVTLIEGTAENSGHYSVRGVPFGIGWTMDVAAHPDYENNNWIYLTYSELCSDECEAGSTIFPASQLRLDRGRIRDGQWTDVESILQFPYEHYTQMPDTAVGGRITFDDEGHVFVSLGMKHEAGKGVQDMDIPWGKIHRVNDDGGIPADNPFVVSDAGQSNNPLQHTYWTYGHRSPHGLEWNPATRTVWNAEMGPRGGDEINELLPGKNYGWPYHSLGLEYSGFTVARNEWWDVEFDQSQVTLPLVDFTPSPAISSFVFYHGDGFRQWQGNLLQATLKGSSLYRLEFDGNKLQHKELLFNNLGRIRDIEAGYDGFVYLLLESDDESMIVRMIPN